MKYRTKILNDADFISKLVSFVDAAGEYKIPFSETISFYFGEDGNAPKIIC